MGGGTFGGLNRQGMPGDRKNDIVKKEKNFESATRMPTVTPRTKCRDRERKRERDDRDRDREHEREDRERGKRSHTPPYNLRSRHTRSPDSRSRSADRHRRRKNRDEDGDKDRQRASALVPEFVDCIVKEQQPGGADVEADYGAEAMASTSLIDVLFHGNKYEIVSESDAKYAEDLQMQEALVASLLTSHMANSASTSALRPRPTLNSLLKSPGKEVAEPSQSLCEICFENKETWQMFRNATCSHSFCYDCTSKHIIAKIQDNMELITCPGLNCKAMLDFNACRFLVPKDILIQWDESLCNSMILESQKLYCPFNDCSALLVNDDGGIIKEINCPECKRSFCATCHVPWHTEFTCEEFGKLNGEKKAKEDDMVEALAKKKNWRRCPHCNFFVERTEGCLHITCRCKYEFCYRCGSKYGKCGH